MPLPKASDLDLPIKNPEISGPMVDFLKNRKEKTFAPRFSEEEFEKNWEELGERIRAGTKRILQDIQEEFSESKLEQDSRTDC